MTLYEKFLNILNINNWAKEEIYHNRFGEECNRSDNYIEITFTGRKDLNIPEVKLCATILLSGSVNGSPIKDNNHYSLYFEGQYGVVNISALHRWLYEQEYLREATLSEALSLYKVPELKIILDSLGLKKSGTKSDLINRIIKILDDNEKSRILSQCKHLFLTEKGLAFLNENNDYYMWHRKSYGVTFEEFNKYRILQGRKRQFYDTIFQALNEKAYIYQLKQYFSKLEMIYYNLSEVLYDEGRYDLALKYTLFRLYFSTNLASHPYLFDINTVKYNGIKKQEEHIRSCNDVFCRSALNRIVELREYYNEHLLDVVYGYHILPYTLFDKLELADAIYDLLNEVYFDSKHYIDYICIKYEKYIKKFL